MMARSEVLKIVSEFQELGWMNCGLKDPEGLYKKCLEAKHARQDIDIGPPRRGMEHLVWCAECKIVLRLISNTILRFSAILW